MRVPLEWLKEFLDFSDSPEELQKILTMRGLEVEGIEEGADGKVINIELTPNRGDCASIIGVARELSAYFNKGYKIPETVYNETGDPISKDYELKVEIPDKCPLYYLKYIRDIKISDSPPWLQKRLEASGVRPLNNVIDITNYVMLEMGQPLHAFDAGRINGRTVIVRGGREGEKILTLDGQNKSLTLDDIVIADESQPIAIGGVIGGENSSVAENTKDILLESAFFVPDSISRTEQHTGIKTESSYRFTRHVDVKGVKKALDRATNLIEKICGGKPAPGELCEDNMELETKRITVSEEMINKILGTSIDAVQAGKYLESLEFEVDINENTLCAGVPSFRNDVTRPIDLIEEIARLHGYENIQPSMPESRIVTDLLISRDEFAPAEEILKFSGYREAITHSLMSSEIYSSVCIKSEYSAVEIDNPINVNMDILRPNLIFGLLDVSKHNINQKQSPIKFFERGPVFFDTSAAHKPRHLWRGQEVPLSINPEDTPAFKPGIAEWVDENGDYYETSQIAFILESDDFFQAKGVAISILENLNQDFSIEYNMNSDYFARDRCGKIKISDTYIGEFGCLSEKLLKAYRLTNLKFVGGYINIDLMDRGKLNKKFTKWSQYPSVFRDLSLVVPVDLTHSIIYDKIRYKAGEFLKDIQLYDIYQDEKLGSNTKSMTYTLEFNSKNRTLTAQKVDESIDEILKTLKAEFGITLRPQ